MRGLSPVAASGSHSSSRCAGLSLSRPLLSRSTGSRHAGSVIVAHGPSCSAACGIFPDQGSNPCPLHRQADSQPLRHQGSPFLLFLRHHVCGNLSQAAHTKQSSHSQMNKSEMHVTESCLIFYHQRNPYHIAGVNYSGIPCQYPPSKPNP